ncbi:MAG TPA: FtsX-like permease family protein [Gemmatimonadales bacterium]|nr:FtsX-like permease family protein [Gemmatimonadales bacterium]
MIRFLLKGLLRDRSRSLFPLLTVAAGVMLTVFMFAWLRGVEASLLQSTAHFGSGYLRVTTAAYATDADQMPNDLALLGADTILAGLRARYPALRWTPRITFGGLLDVPDARGETRAQAPVAGLGADLLSPGSPEPGLLRLAAALVRGRLPARRGEALVSEELATRLGIRPGQTATLIGSTMNGAMALANFTVVGTVRFGIGPMDHGALVADLADVRAALDMEDGASAILGFFRDDLYHERTADSVAASFDAAARSTGRYRPVMETLRQASGLSDLLDYIAVILDAVIAFFVFAMSIVLWNAGLMGSLRRYGEIGVRLAVGEDQGHVYRAMLVEAVAIGLVGSLVGTAIGLAASYVLQVHGINVRALLKDNTMMMEDVLRARVTPGAALVGFVPGLLATVLGAGISGLGIYRRQTSQLFKELEA